MDNKKNQYKKPTIYMVKLSYHSLMQNNTDGTVGGGLSREQRSDWDEE